MREQYLIIESGQIVNAREWQQWIKQDSIARLLALAAMDTCYLFPLARLHGDPEIFAPAAQQARLGYLLIEPGDLNKSEMPEALGVIRICADFIGAGIEGARMREQIFRWLPRDPMTGLASKRYFLDLLDRELQLLDSSIGPDAAERRSSRGGSLVLVDIDHTKSLNDYYGFGIADNALIMLAKLIKQSIRPMDLACRFAGDKYCLMLPGLDVNAALAWAEGLRATLERTPVDVPDGEPTSITASFGIAAYPRTGVEKEECGAKSCVLDAEQAVAEAKADGRNRVKLSVSLN